jgi:hypothetical protein
LGSESFAFQEAWGTLTSARGAAEDKAVHATMLMAALHQRILDRADLAAAARLGLPSRGPAHSLRTELEWLQASEGEPVIGRIADYIVERVIRRHSWVAMQKLRRQRDYTFLFEARDGRLVYLNSYQPVATTPRLAPAIQFLEDIHLIGEEGPTPQGLEILEAAQ